MSKTLHIKQSDTFYGASIPSMSMDADYRMLIGVPVK